MTMRAVGVAMTLLPTALGTTAAHASTGEPSPVPEVQKQSGEISPRAAVGHYSKLINKTAKKNYTNTKNEIARCTAQTKGMTCMINKTSSATRTIDAGFGLSRNGVAASLNISKAKTQSVSVTCSAKVSKGHSLVAYPIGTRYKYKIEKHITTPLDYKAGTSGWKYAFDPAPAKVSCKVI
ncbi:hypothetical protein [Streptomyces violens]|uniref:hypothetical protein n=1 Tax=Streptomyces violens TaxID=66377 RepID=UPI0012FEFAD6|nr:hypothetical protein [Streptomyces violens]